MVIIGMRDRVKGLTRKHSKDCSKEFMSSSKDSFFKWKSLFFSFIEITFKIWI